MKNQSEQQLKQFLKYRKAKVIKFTLSPQGDNTTISKDSINLCVIHTEYREYSFGGISENFYDKMYLKFGKKEKYK